MYDLQAIGHGAIGPEPRRAAERHHPQGAARQRCGQRPVCMAHLRAVQQAHRHPRQGLYPNVFRAVSAGRREAAEVADDLLDLITLDDLNEEQRQLAELIGLEGYKALVRTYGGTHIDIPKADRLTMDRRNDRIVDTYDGYNVRELARKWGLSESRIYVLTKSKRDKIRSRVPDNQIMLF